METNVLDGDTVYEFNGHKLFAGSTAYGDGSYMDNYGRSYGVDAGLIGLVPVGLIEAGSTVKDKNGKFCNLDGTGCLITFDKDVFISYNNGVFGFNNIIIDTLNEDEYDDEDDSYDDYEDDIYSEYEDDGDED